MTRFTMRQICSLQYLAQPHMYRDAAHQCTEPKVFSNRYQPADTNLVRHECLDWTPSMLLSFCQANSWQVNSHMLASLNCLSWQRCTSAVRTCWQLQNSFFALQDSSGKSRCAGTHINGNASDSRFYRQRFVSVLDWAPFASLAIQIVHG